MTPTDPCRDFDFEHGRWHVRHRRLKARLADCHDWEEFDGTSETHPVLGGNGNVEDNLIHLPAGSYRAIALRSYDPASASWSIWWLDARAPHTIDTPVVGRFENGTGTFYADESLDGRPVRLRFFWLRTDTDSPRWEQALSGDGGETWETNWTMDFSRG